MDRTEAYKYLGCAYQYNKNKTLADRILDVLEKCTNPKGMTTSEIVKALNKGFEDNYFYSQVERILKELWGRGYGWRPSFVTKELIADGTTIANIQVYWDKVRVDSNGNYVFTDKMVVNGKTIEGDFTSYFDTLAPNKCPRVYGYEVEVPMEVPIRRNYWRIKGE